MTNPNNDPSNLHPGPDDPVLKFDEALKGLIEQLENGDFEDLEATLILIEQKMTAAGASTL